MILAGRETRECGQPESANTRRRDGRAVGTVNAPSLAPLAPAVAAYVNPADADKIGAPLGSPVRLVGAKGTVGFPLAASTAVPRGIVLVPFKQTGSDASPTSIVDVDAGATDVRIEAG